MERGAAAGVGHRVDVRTLLEQQVDGRQVAVRARLPQRLAAVPVDDVPGLIRLAPLWQLFQRGAQRLLVAYEACGVYGLGKLVVHALRDKAKASQHLWLRPLRVRQEPNGRRVVETVVLEGLFAKRIYPLALCEVVDLRLQPL